MEISESVRYLTAAELATYLRSTLGSIRVKTSRREIPHVKFGRRVLYDKQEIDSWLADQKVPALR
jgi:excisionase family DNA binding protein